MNHCLAEIKDEVYRLPIFEGLSRSTIESLLEHATVSVTYNGESLFKQGQDAEFFGYVISGAYKLRHLNKEGKEHIMYIGLYGEALGIMGVMQDRALFPFDAISVGCSRFIKIPRSTFMTHWLHNFLVMLRFQSDLQQRIFKSYNEKLIGHRDLEGRIAQFFVYLIECKEEPAGTTPVLELTRKEISNYLGVSSEAVIRKLSLWTKKKWIATTGAKIKILRYKEIEDLAGDCTLKLVPKNRNEQKSMAKVVRLNSLQEETKVALCAGQSIS